MLKELKDKTHYMEILVRGIWKENPVAYQVLGICSALAVTVKMSTAIVMAIALMFLLSAVASRYSHLLLNKFKKDRLLSLIWIGSSITSVLLIVLGNSLISTIGLFSLFYVLLNIRKPVMIEKISEEISPDVRASILSVESQLTSLLIIVLAPLFGYVFDNYGIDYVFVSIAVISILSSLMYRKKND